MNRHLPELSPAPRKLGSQFPAASNSSPFLPVSDPSEFGSPEQTSLPHSTPAASLSPSLSEPLSASPLQSKPAQIIHNNIFIAKFEKFLNPKKIDDEESDNTIAFCQQIFFMAAMRVGRKGDWF